MERPQPCAAKIANTVDYSENYRGHNAGWHTSAAGHTELTKTKWVPRISLDEGLVSTYQHYVNNGQFSLEDVGHLFCETPSAYLITEAEVVDNGFCRSLCHRSTGLHTN